MADLEDIADDVPAREAGKILKGEAAAYVMESVLETNFSGPGGVPQNGRTITIDAGQAVDTDAAGMRSLIGVYDCNTSDAPVSGESVGVNTSGQLEGGEALNTDLSVGKYTKGKILRADGTNFTDQAVGIVHAVTGTSAGSPPSGSLGSVPDLAIDHAASLSWIKTGTTTWTIFGSSTSPYSIIAQTTVNFVSLSSGVAKEVEWRDGTAEFSDDDWTYDGSSGHDAWTPPVAGLYEITIGITIETNPVADSSFIMIGYIDPGTGTYGLWTNGGISNSGVGHASATTQSYGSSVISTIMQLETDYKVSCRITAASNNQRIVGTRGFFKAVRLRA